MDGQLYSWSTQAHRSERSLPRSFLQIVVVEVSGHMLVSQTEHLKDHYIEAEEHALHLLDQKAKNN